jgi:hypothetical protein
VPASSSTVLTSSLVKPAAASARDVTLCRFGVMNPRDPRDV